MHPRGPFGAVVRDRRDQERADRHGLIGDEVERSTIAMISIANCVIQTSASGSNVPTVRALNLSSPAVAGFRFPKQGPLDVSAAERAKRDDC